MTSRSQWSTDTNYFAYFEPDLDNPREQIQRGKLVKNWQEYQETADDEDDELNRVKCNGNKTDGGSCHQLTDHISGYCTPHRDQWDGETADKRHEDQ